MNSNMINAQSNIERVVMRRVRLIRIMALIISTASLALATSVVALWGIGREVWVAKVFENTQNAHGLLALAQFWFAAFLHTRFIVQALIILTIASFVLLLRELTKPFFSYQA